MYIYNYYQLLEYYNNLEILCSIIILIIIGQILDYIIELIQFKKFVKKYYYVNINILIFTKNLIKEKVKKHDII